MPAGFERRLAAVLSADVKGYSRLMGEDETGTVRTLTTYRALIADLVAQHRGRVVDAPGDNVLAEFPSAVNAIEAAVTIQDAIRARNTELPEPRRMLFRIGINVGDVVVEGERLYGDGVNIAARLEQLAPAGGVCISGTAYDQVKNKVHVVWEAIGDQTLKNIAEPVRVYRMRSIESSVGTPVENMATTGPSECPSLAVLPFTNLSPEPDQSYFADGITEDLITDLSKISGLLVIARHSAWTYKGRSTPSEEIGRTLGVQYLLEGAIRRAGVRIRVTTRLSEAATGRLFWAERYDREISEIFELQDHLTKRIVQELEITLTKGEEVRLLRRLASSVQVYELLLQGYERFWRFRRDQNHEAHILAERALAEDSNSPGAHLLLGLTRFQEAILGWVMDTQAALRDAVLHARRALSIDDSAFTAYGILSWASVLEGRHDEGIAFGERALALAPNSADGAASLADVLNLSGRAADGLPYIRRAMRLNPIHPVYYLTVLAHAYRLLGRHEEAIAVYEDSLAREPDNRRARPNLAIVYLQLGRDDEARAQVRKTLDSNPQFSVSRWALATPYKDREHLEREIQTLRRAGFS